VTRLSLKRAERGSGRPREQLDKPPAEHRRAERLRDVAVGACGEAALDVLAGARRLCPESPAPSRSRRVEPVEEPRLLGLGDAVVSSTSSVRIASATRTRTETLPRPA
jgi:hypothetical protein